MIREEDNGAARRRRGDGEVQVLDKKMTDEPKKTDNKTTGTARVLLLATLSLLPLLVLICSPDSLKSVSTLAGWLLYNTGLSSPLFAVVLDAGSTGSRVMAFTFTRDLMSSRLVLRDEMLREVKPGLSSFASDAKGGAETVGKLVEQAKARVPRSEWRDTPVTLLATAGLRMLPQNQSEAIIGRVRRLLQGSGFRFEGVDIMSELDEGVFGWMSVNYLLDRLHMPRKSYVALDLGGGSTQITFLPKFQETFDTAPTSYLHPFKVLATPQTLYSHSYLGLGLMAAREAVFRMGDPENSLDLVTACVNTTQTFTFHSNHYVIRPDTRPGYELCMSEVQAMLDMQDIHQCPEVPTRKIAAFSYFHDRAVDSGILAPDQMAAVVTVQQYLDAAQTACNSPSPSQPFLCVDLAYISGLLHHGYRLKAGAKLGLYKRIAGYGTSWGLGAAFNLLD